MLWRISLIFLCIGCSTLKHPSKPIQDSFSPELLAQKPMKILCYGDSITASKWPEQLAVKLEESTPGQYKIINRGRSGDTSVGAFYRMRGHVLPELPAVVLIEFGINDSNSPYWGKIARVSLSEYREKMQAICQTVRDRGGYPVFIVNHPIVYPDLSKVGGNEGRQKKVKAYWTQPGNGRSPIENLKIYNEAVREIAASNGAPIIDLPAIMSREKIDPIGKEMLADDGVHLTDKGKEIYASLVYKRLLEILPQADK